MNAQSKAFDDVIEERRRQDSKWGPNAARSLDPSRRLCILVEEVGEVAQVINDLRDPGKNIPQARLREELIQVAAVAIAWLEALQ